MKRKLVLGLLVFVSLFTITGCGSKKEDNKESDNSNSSSSNVATVVTCKQKTDSFDAISVVNFDKDDMLIDGKTTTTYVNESDAQNNYKYRKEAADAGSIETATIDKNVVTQTFTSKSTDLSYIGTKNKENYIRYATKAGWTCE